MKTKIISIVLVCVILGGMTVTVLAGPVKGSAYSLTVLCAGSGRVTVTVDGELMHSGGGNCMISVPEGAVVSVSAEKITNCFSPLFSPTNFAMSGFFSSSRVMLSALIFCDDLFLTR